MARRVLVTRAASQAEELCALLTGAGFLPVLHPAIGFRSGDLGPLLDALPEAEWLAFTSANGVRYFFEEYHGPLPRRIGVVGSATRTVLEGYGHKADFAPDVFQAEELAAGLPDVDGRTVVIPQAADARPVLAELLRARGARVVTAPAYRTVTLHSGPPPRDVHAVTFTSPSTVSGYIKQGGSVGGAVVACIGPVTAEAAQRAGMQVVVHAEPRTAGGLVTGLTTYFRTHP